MENFSLAGITLSIFFDTRRSKDELWFPVKYRVTHMRKRTYISTGIDLTEEEWKALPNARKRELVENRELIYAGFDQVKSEIKEMVKGEGFSIQGLVRRLKRGMKDSLNKAFENKISELRKSGQIGTAITYECALKSVQKYTSKDLAFSDITQEWLKRYEAHLFDEDKSRTTIKFYMGCIRAIMNEARELRIITDAQYPFGKGKYEIKTAIGRKLALSLQQIHDVLKFPLSSKSERMMRDLWFFSYMTNGINFNDMLHLKYKDIVAGEIHFLRRKTIRTTKQQKEVVATLLPEMKDIIKKWGNPEKKPDNYIFPFLSKEMNAQEEKRAIQNVVRLCNKKMAQISKELKLERISTYTARHSYATVLKRSGANISFISESLGHSDLRTTESYLASFESAERAKNAALLTNFKPKKQTKKRKSNVKE
jgi:integrase